MSSKRNREEEEEDDDLAKAIALSLQEQEQQKQQPANKKSKVDVIEINDEEDEDLKRAIAESLADSQGTESNYNNYNNFNNYNNKNNNNNNNTEKEKESNSQSQFKLNFIEGLSSQANSNSVRLSDLLDKKDLQAAFISSYAIDIDWFLEVFPKRVPLTLVKHYDSKVDKPGHFVLSSNITILHPPLLPFSNMHAKLMLLIYPNFIRVVISSSNLTKEDWYQVGQVVWHQDFPKLQKGENVDCENEFSRNLRHFMECLQAKAHFLKQYDFRAAKVQLILSVPGYHNNDNLNRYGHMQLRNIINEHNNNNNNTHSEKNNKNDDTNRTAYYQTSSLGSTEETWVKEFVDSAYGLQKTNTKKKSGNNNNNNNNNNNTNLNIIFPSAKSVYAKDSRRLKPGANMVCLSSKSWNSGKFPKHLLHKTQWNHSYSLKENIIMHSKVLLCTNIQPNQNYVYIGSHNFTQAAWGRLQKDGTQLHINNYELGVVSLDPQDIKGVPFQYPPIPFNPSESPWLM